MTNEELCAKWGMSSDELEALREKHGGVFSATVHDQYGNVKDVESVHNIVTNEGPNYILGGLSTGGATINPWRVALSKSTTAPAAGMTYATPSFTEVAGADVSETIRQVWNDNGVASQSIDNSTTQAVYTATTTAITAYGAGLVGGTGSSVIANTTNAGTLYAYSKFATSKALSNTDTISVTYTFTSASST